MTVNRVSERAFETSVQTEAMIERLQVTLDEMRVELDRSHHLLIHIAESLGVDRRPTITRVTHEKPAPLPRATARVRKP